MKTGVKDTPKKPTQRRTHAERRATTYAKVVRGTVDLINEDGVVHLTVARIVEKTGVSWGSMQNLFGTKDGLLLVICQIFLDEIKEMLDALPIRKDYSLREKVMVMVNCMKEIYESPTYIAAAEIFRNPPHDVDVREQLHAKLRHGRQVTDQAWLRFFSEDNYKPDRIIFVRHIVNMAMSGLGRDREWNDPISYEWHIPNRSFNNAAINFLIDGIVNYLSADLEDPGTAEGAGD